MAETSSRLLTLLSLLQARRVWAGPQLTEKLQVSSRTMRRDIENLRTMGYHIEAIKGPAGGYQLGAGSALPPLRDSTTRQIRNRASASCHRDGPNPITSWVTTDGGISSRGISTQTPGGRSASTA